MNKALDRLAKAQKDLNFVQEMFQSDLTEAEKNRDWIIKQAVAVGMPEKGANIPNAKSTLEKSLEQHLALKTDLETWAQNLGYDSFARARMAIGARTNRHDLTVEQLPVAYQKMPIKLRLNKSDLELRRIERMLPRVQKELLNAFEIGVSTKEETEIAKAWAGLEKLADLVGFYTELILCNNNYEEPAPPETVPTSNMVARFGQADKFSGVFISDLTAVVEATPIEIEIKKYGHRLYDNVNKVVEFVLWQHLAPNMDEVVFENYLQHFAVYLEDKGLAVPKGKILENKTVASATHRYDWVWAETVCLKDLIDYLAINGIEVGEIAEEEQVLAYIEETDEELLGCL